MFRLPTIKESISGMLSMTIYDIKFPNVGTPLSTFFGGAVFLLANLGRDYFKGYRGKECILYISLDDYYRIGGIQAQYTTMYYEYLKEGTAHSTMTFSNDGTIAVLGNDSYVEVITVDGQWNSSTAYKSYFRSASAFRGVSSIAFLNDTELGFVVEDHTIFDVPYFQYTLYETLTSTF